MPCSKINSERIDLKTKPETKITRGLHREKNLDVGLRNDFNDILDMTQMHK